MHIYKKEDVLLILHGSPTVMHDQEDIMKLAICDDSPRFLNAFRTELFKLDPSISLVCYTSYEKLASSFEIIPFDAVIINAEIDGESGIDVAFRLVHRKPGTEIIFTTDKCDKYAQLIFSHADVMRPFAFLVKPISRVFMQQIINMLSQSLKNRGCATLLIKNSSRELFTIRYSEIKYIEHNNRISYIHTDTEVIPCRKPIQFFEETLPGSFFIHASKSILVNASKVTAVQQNMITLASGDSIYASRNYRKDFIEQIETFTASDINSAEPQFI